MAASADSTSKFVIASKYQGRLCDGSADLFVVRSPADLAKAQAAVADKEPIHATGRMAIEGWRDRTDPLTTGELKDGVDFVASSIIVVGGRCCDIEMVTTDDSGSISITCAHNPSVHHGRAYSAVVVSPPVPDGAEVTVCGLEGAPASVHAHAMVSSGGFPGPGAGEHAEEEALEVPMLSGGGGGAFVGQNVQSGFPLDMGGRGGL